MRLLRIFILFFSVIDCGFVKMKWFDAETCTDRLITVPISKSSADQRAGRAGRMRLGKVYRYVFNRFLSEAQCT